MWGFERPLLLLAGPLALAWLAWWHRRSATGLSKGPAITILVLTGLASCLLAGGMAGPYRTRSVASLVDLTLLVDGSASMDDPALQWASAQVAKFVRAAPDTSRLRVGTFAGTVVWLDSPTSALTRPPGSSDGTDIGRALSLALSSNLEERPNATRQESARRRIVLISDGNDTVGEAVEGAAIARRAGVQVSVLAPAVDPQPEIAVTVLNVPRTVIRGREFTASVDIAMSRPGRVLCGLRVGGGPVRNQEIRSGSGTLRWSGLSVPPGVVDRFEVRVDCTPADPASDTWPQNNGRSEVVDVAGRMRVWCLDIPGTQCDRVVDVLGDAADVEAIDKERLGRKVEGEPPDVVVIGDTGPGVLPPLVPSLLGLAGRGTGVLFLGGRAALSMAELAGTSVERDLLPVFLTKRGQEETPARAVLLVLDRSASMSGKKIAIAREAAIAAVQALPPDTLLGIIAFDTVVHVVLRPVPVGDATRATSLLASIQPNGGTDILKALQAARDMLVPVKASEKTVVLLTDGRSDPKGVVETAQAIGQLGAQISTIAVGPEPDRDLLAQVAELSGGRHYYARGPEAVPRLLLAEVAKEDDSATVTGPHRVVPAGDALGRRVFRGVDRAALPPVEGYNVVLPRPDGEPVAASDKQHPLIAVRRVKNGMTAVFAAGLDPEWSQRFTASPGGRRLLLNLVTLLAGEGRPIRPDAGVSVDDSGLTVTADVLGPERTPVDGAEVVATVVAPDGRRHELTLAHQGLGRYSGFLPASGTPESRTGTWQATVLVSVAGNRLPAIVRHASYPFPEELRRFGQDRKLLAAIAEAGGGMVDPTPDQVFADPGQTSIRDPLGAWAYLPALGFFLLAVWVRRL